MNSLKTAFCVALPCALLLVSNLFSVPPQTQTGNQGVPQEVTVEYDGAPHKLKLTGTASRTKFFVKVYNISLYLEQLPKEKSNAAFNEILNGKQIEQLTSVWVRNVEAKKVQDGYRESLQKTIPGSEMESMRSYMEQFIGFYNQNVKSGDRHNLRWFPDGTVQIEINGEKKGSIKNEAFARHLWSVWLGEKSVVNRNGLISFIPK